MAVDRGSLDYTIRISNAWSKPLQQFKQEMAAARNEILQLRNATAGLSDFRKDLGEAAKSVKLFGQESAAASTNAVSGAEAERKARTDAFNAARKEFQQFNKDTSERERNSKKVVTSAQAEQKARSEAFKQARSEFVAFSREADERDKNAKKIIEAEKKKTKASADAARKFRQDQKSILKDLTSTDDAVNRLGFTFRRLVGILAVFTLAREAAGGFKSFVTDGLKFNQTIEDSELGLAGLITSVGQVSTLQGKAVEGAEKFAAAQGEAQRQTQLLRLDALKTSATFEQLISAFQTALGPGLAAGFNLDQIRKLTVQISLAAKALGVSQDQLAEEIRSLFGASGSARTTRLLVLFQKGELKALQSKGPQAFFDGLTQRLAAFDIAADKSQRTLSGLLQRLREAASIASGVAEQDLFQAVKGAVEGLGDLFVTVERDAKGAITAITPKPETVAILRLIADFLTRIVTSLTSGLKNVSFTAIFNGVSQLIGVLESILSVALAVGRGLVAGFAVALPIIKSLANVLTALAPLVEIFVAIRVNVFIITSIVKGLITQFTTLNVLTKLFGLNMKQAEGEVTKTKISANGLAQAFTLVGTIATFALSEILSAIFQVNIGFSETIQLVSGSFIDALDALIVKLQSVGNSAQKTLAIFRKDDQRNFFVKLAADVGKVGASLDEMALRALGATKLADKFATAIANDLNKAEETASAAEQERQKELAATQAKLDEERLARRKKFEEAIAKILTKSDLPSGTEGAEAAAARIKAEFDKARKEIEKGFNVTAPDQPPTQQQQDEQQLNFLKLKQKGEELALEEEINNIKSEQFTKEKEDLTIAQQKLATLRQQLTFQENIVDARPEVRQARLDVKNARGPEALAFANEKLLQVLKEQEQTQDDIRNKIRGQELEIDELTKRARLAGSELGQALDKLAELKKQQREQGTEGLITKEISDAQLRVDELTARASGDLQEGFAFGLKSFAVEFADAVQAGIDIAKSAVQQFAGFVTDVITDAFDPNSDTSFRERFAQFLQGLAKMILQTIISLLLATAIAKAFGVPLPGDQTPPPTIPFSVVGLAGGGTIPGGSQYETPAPAGIPRSDTVLMRGTPGEYVMPVAETAKFYDLLEAMRAGAIDPATAEALVGMRRYTRARRSTRGAYAAGGVVDTGIALQKAGGSGGSPTATAPSMPTPAVAVIAPSERGMDRQLRGGKKAFFAFVREHAAQLDGILSKERK